MQFEVDYCVLYIVDCFLNGRSEIKINPAKAGRRQELEEH
jgi:hypothetical protein